MDSSLESRRKFFFTSYSAYLKADRDWTEALNAASAIVPDVVGHGYWRLGAPRSRLRRLYLERDRALHRMMVARLKLAAAKRRQSPRSPEMLLLIEGQ